MPTHQTLEAELVKELTIQLPSGIDQGRVQFEQGDALDLREGLGQFDAVLACNLICRLPDPKKFLDRLPRLLNPGGQLFLTTPFTWLERVHPQGKLAPWGWHVQF